MQINRNNFNQPAFSAKVPDELRKIILTESVEFGTEGLNNAKNQISKISQWGSPRTYIDVAYNLVNQKGFLGISNIEISKKYGAIFKQKSSLLETFMSLKEKDILDAEKRISKEVMRSKTDLVLKMLSDEKLMERVTGETNPTPEKINSIVSKLSEDEIINYRFYSEDNLGFNAGESFDLKI